MFFTFVLFYLLRSCTFGWPKGSWKCPKRLPRSPLYFRLLQFGHSERNQTAHEKNCHRLDAWSHWGREMQVKRILSKSIKLFNSFHYLIKNQPEPWIISVWCDTFIFSKRKYCCLKNQWWWLPLKDCRLWLRLNSINCMNFDNWETWKLSPIGLSMELRNSELSFETASKSLS